MKRWIMKKIAADTGKETDTSKNHVFTDWGDVEAFVEDFRTCVESDQGESH
jgi:menaquinone-dependent protoporphyrinogen IX oxidase